MDEILQKVLAGNIQTLGRVISWIEDGLPEGRKILEALCSRIGQALRLGFAGPPGVGKSTLINELSSLLREQGKKIGIIASDPTSPFTGGAFLGDRIRMTKLIHTDTFIRSMATRGSYGGISPSAPDVADLLDASGKDYILIETIGTGQVDVEVVSCTDCTVVVLSPESGDAIQMMKAGLIEIADIFVINKADRSGADRIRHHINSVLSLGARNIPVLLSEAISAKGIPELLNAIEGFLNSCRANGKFIQRRARNLEKRVRRAAEELLQAQFWRPKREELDQLVCDIMEGRSSIYSAARRLLQRDG
jgi:LAO/AO transport system kinase